MNIAVIGGSIAGCAVALLLKDKFNITVYERTGNLQSRGAGITIPKELLTTLINKNMLDFDIVAYSLTNRKFYCHSSKNTDYGYCLWQQNIETVSLHWDTLFSNLRKRLPDALYKNNVKVNRVEFNDYSPNQIILEGGAIHQADLVVFADGANSLGRQIISKNKSLAYCGYVAWRGVINVNQIPSQVFLPDGIPYYCFDTGHLLTYPVYQNGTKKLNWVFYEQLSLANLDALETSNQHNLSATATQHLHQLAKSKLPKAIAQIIIDTHQPFMQKIVDVCPDKLIYKNSLLLGDAGIVLRPHVGSGASLALQDALNLCELLCNESMTHALSKWEQSTLINRYSMYELSRRMADALVLNPTLWQEMNEATMAHWWQDIIRNDQWYTSLDK